MANEKKYDDDKFIINLTIDGTAFEEVEVKVTEPQKTIRDQIARIIAVFDLPKVDNGGCLVQYLLGIEMEDGEPEIFEFEDEDGREKTLIDYNVLPGDHLHLVSVPIPGSYTLVNEEIYEDDEFIINLTIDGTNYEKVEVKVSDPVMTIREQIASIVAVFDLPKVDNGGCLVQYLLGIEMEDGEPEILEFEDEDGREQALVDYNVQPGDHLHLVSVPIPGSLWSNIVIVKTIDLKLLRFQRIQIYEFDNNRNIDVCRLYGWVNNIVNNFISRFRLNSNCQYYLAKLNRGSDGMKLFFLNGEEGHINNKKSIFDYEKELSPENNEFPTLVLFPTTGISPRIMRKIEKYYYTKQKL